MSERAPGATQCLKQLNAGDSKAADRLLPLVYDELLALARGHLHGERKDHTLSATGLVHEAYLRLIDVTQIGWQGRTHFFAMAAKTVRRVLVDHARARDAEKRGGHAERITLSDTLAFHHEKILDVLALDAALEKLGRVSPRQHDVVELRFFAGLTVKEAALSLGVSADTIKWDWRMARAWLMRELRVPGDEERDGE